MAEGFALTVRGSWELMIRQAIDKYRRGLVGPVELQETILRWTIRAERETVHVEGWFV